MDTTLGAFCTFWLGLGLELFYPLRHGQKNLVLSSLVNKTCVSKSERKGKTAS